MEDIKNIPNTVTLLRLLLLLPMFIFFLNGQFDLFVVFFIFGSVCDGIDGYLARKLRLETKFGTKFDSITDFLYIISIIFWLWFLLDKVFIANKSILIPLVILVLFHFIYSFIKFSTITSYHLYSMKLLVGLIYIFLVHTIMFNFSRVFFLAVICLSYIVCLENIIISIILKQEKQNIKTVFHVLKQIK